MAVEDIILVGFGGHAKSVADTIDQGMHYHIVGYIDHKPDSRCADFQWLGTDDKLAEYYQKGIRNAIIGVGFMGHHTIRDRLYMQLKKIGYRLPVIIDETAVIAKDVLIGEGTYVGKCAVINAGSMIGKMCIINTGALVEHENSIGDYSHIAVRSVLCGKVQIGMHVFIGANATIIQGIQIENECIIGAGSVVLSNVPEKRTVYGTIGRGASKVE